MTTIATRHGDARVLWDSDHGPDNEGWFIRYSNGNQDHLDEILAATTETDATTEATEFLRREGLLLEDDCAHIDVDDLDDGTTRCVHCGTTA